MGAPPHLRADARTWVADEVPGPGIRPARDLPAPSAGRTASRFEPWPLHRRRRARAVGRPQRRLVPGMVESDSIRTEPPSATRDWGWHAHARSIAPGVRPGADERRLTTAPA